MRDWFFIPGIKPKKKRDPNAPRYGDVHDRSLAAALDLLLIYVLFEPLLFRRITMTFDANIDQEKLAAANQSATVGELLHRLHEAHFIENWLANSFVHGVIIMAMIVLAQIFIGNTPGKWILGLKIVRRTTHAKVEPWRYVLRICACFFAALPLMIGIIWMMFNRERRGWHDMIAGTVVLNTRPEWWYWEQVKRGFRWVRAKLTGSALQEQPVAEPTASESHQDGDKPIR